MLIKVTNFINIQLSTVIKISSVTEIGNFRSFFALSPPKNPKDHISKKMKKIVEDIIILHMCPINDNMMYVSCNMEIIFCSFGPFFALSLFCH